MTRPNIIITGFMGTGKTTVGRLLATKLGYDFIDMDELIVARSCQTVEKIFQDKGEEAFREMEAIVAMELGGKEGLVISTGGRTMLDPTNAAALSKRGRVFCLVATPEEIMERLARDPEVRRPLLDGSNPMARIVEIMREREEGYARFPQLVTSGKSPEELTNLLLKIIQSESSRP
jgi:shikimate kinase